MQNQQPQVYHARPDSYIDKKANNQEQKNIISRTNNQTFKAKCAIFFGYNGEKYLGMQYQRDTENTIQNIMHRIMADGGFILKTNQGELKRIHWSRAARTDKKVHALCNGISVKLQISNKFTDKDSQKQIDFDKLINHFNSQLPIDIRIFAMKKAAKGFDMRHDAMTRIYNYIIPLYIFQKYQDFKLGKIPSYEEETQILQKLNVQCKIYLGTHNFHNFTKGYKQNDPKTERYMISMKAQTVQKEVFERYWSLHKEDEGQKRNVQRERFIRFTLVGQSFIYHQIRKMIGLLVKIFSLDLQGESVIKQAFKPQKYDLFLAPGEGLYLNRMTFQGYNKRKQRNNEKTVELNQIQESRVLKFRQYLQSQILHHEVEQKVFVEWLKNTVEHKIEEKQESGSEEQQQEEKREDQEDNQQKQGTHQKKDKINNSKGNKKGNRRRH